MQLMIVLGFTWLCLGLPPVSVLRVMALVLRESHIVLGVELWSAACQSSILIPVLPVCPNYLFFKA